MTSWGDFFGGFILGGITVIVFALAWEIYESKDDLPYD